MFAAQHTCISLRGKFRQHNNVSLGIPNTSTTYEIKGYKCLLNQNWTLKIV